MTSPVHVVANVWETNRDILSNKVNAWKNKTDNPAISSYTYTVNNLGQRTVVTTAGEAFAQSPSDWSWNYDALDQVTQANDDQYAYDQIGNRLTSGKEQGAQTAYTANTLNQYAAINTTQPTYDADGNQLTGLLPTSDQSNRASLAFTYNAANRPIEIRQDGDWKENRSYDHMGRRICKGDTLTLYDGYNAIAEYNLNTQALKATYAWGNDLSGSPQGAGGVGGLLSVTEHDKQIPLVSYPCYDGNGNITEYLTEENGGALATHYEYDAFGNVTKKTGEKEYSYQFSTKPYDPLTGLNYYNYREYDGSVGKWMSRDRIEEKGGLNIYNFAANKPVCNIDILGEQSSGDDDCKKCNEHLEKKKKDYPYSIKHMEDNGCKIIFACAKLGEGTNGQTQLIDAGGLFTKRTIKITINCCTGANQPMGGTQDDTFGHELEHAKDHCYKTREPGCAGSICTEIKAYAVGGCKGFQGEALKQCLKYRVPGSSASHCTKGENMDQLFEDNYEKCIKGVSN